MPEVVREMLPPAVACLFGQNLPAALHVDFEVLIVKHAAI